MQISVTIIDANNPNMCEPAQLDRIPGIDEVIQLPDGRTGTITSNRVRNDILMTEGMSNHCITVEFH